MEIASGFNGILTMYMFLFQKSLKVGPVLKNLNDFNTIQDPFLSKAFYKYALLKYMKQAQNIQENNKTRNGNDNREKRDTTVKPVSNRLNDFNTIQDPFLSKAFYKYARLKHMKKVQKVDNIRENVSNMINRNGRNGLDRQQRNTQGQQRTTQGQDPFLSKAFYKYAMLKHTKKVQKNHNKPENISNMLNRNERKATGSHGNMDGSHGNMDGLNGRQRHTEEHMFEIMDPMCIFNSIFPLYQCKVMNVRSISKRGNMMAQNIKEIQLQNQVKIQLENPVNFTQQHNSRDIQPDSPAKLEPQNPSKTENLQKIKAENPWKMQVSDQLLQACLIRCYTGHSK